MTGMSREQLLQKAIECFRKAGNPAKVAECYEEWPKHLEAARIYEQECRDHERAARCYAMAHQYAQAARLYLKALNDEEALKNFMKAGDFLAAGSVLEQRVKDLPRAARIYEQGACYAEAARLWDRKLGKPERALNLYFKALERMPAGPSPRRAEALFAAAGLVHAAGDERRREDLIEQGERVAEQLAEAGRSADAARAWEALGEFGVRAGRSHHADAGYECALRLYRQAANPDGVRRTVAAYLEHARSVGNRSLVERLEREEGSEH